MFTSTIAPDAEQWFVLHLYRTVFDINNIHEKNIFIWLWLCLREKMKKRGRESLLEEGHKSCNHSTDELRI